MRNPEHRQDDESPANWEIGLLSICVAACIVGGFSHKDEIGSAVSGVLDGWRGNGSAAADKTPGAKPKTETAKPTPTETTPPPVLFAQNEEKLKNKGVNLAEISAMADAVWAPKTKGEPNPASVFSVLNAKVGSDVGIQSSTTIEEANTKIMNSGFFVGFSGDIKGEARSCLPAGMLVIYPDKSDANKFLVAISLGATKNDMYKGKATLANANGITAASELTGTAKLFAYQYVRKTG